MTPVENGNPVTRAELNAVKDVVAAEIRPLLPLPAAVTLLAVQQATVIEQLRHVVTPENCPIAHNVQELRIAIRDSSHEGLANSTFRIQTKAYFVAAMFLLTLLSSTATVLLSHVLG